MALDAGAPAGGAASGRRTPHQGEERLGELVTREMGKVIAEGLGDVQEVVEIAFYMEGEGRRLKKAQIDK